MAQSAEHILGKDEVTGSNPVNSSMSEQALIACSDFFVEDGSLSARIEEVSISTNFSSDR